jgi:uncharacterized membrane protein
VLLHAPAHVRVPAAVLAGLAAFGVVALVLPWPMALLAGWNTTALVIVVWSLLVVIRSDADATSRLAQREDYSHVTADLLQVGACLAALAIIAFALLDAADEKDAAQVWATLHALLGVVLAWAVVHSVYTLRYARLYYQDGRGIDFNDEDAPDFRDFAYMAFTVGMTYQVADTDLTSKAMRHTVLRHALLSYLFGTVILAVTINVVASLLR